MGGGNFNSHEGGPRGVLHRNLPPDVETNGPDVETNGLLFPRENFYSHEGGPGGVLHRPPEFDIKFQNFRKLTRKNLISR